MTPAFPADLDGQFLLSPAPLPPDPFAGGPHAGADVALPSLHLRVWPGLPVIPAIDAGGRRIGVFLGVPVDPVARSVPHEAIRLSAALPADLASGSGAATPDAATPDAATLDAGTLDAGTPDAATLDAADAFVEDAVHRRLAGRFAFVLDAPGARRLYLDACGSLSAVHAADLRLAGATAPALLGPEAAAARFDADLHAALDVTHEGWFPGGLTAHRGVARLMANHRLDLDAWSATRHWPLAPIAPAADPQAACRTLLDGARAVIDALRADRPVAMSLTAGNETRFLLAACRDIAAEIDFVTADGPTAALDLHRAKELAARFGLARRTLPHRRADAAAAADWEARAGRCIGGGNMWSHPTVDPLAREGRTLIAGFGGEIGRGFFWRPVDTATTTVDADTLVARFGMPANPRVRAAVQAWVEDWAATGRGRFDAFQTLDIAYLELRMSCWAFAQAHVAPRLPEVSPMISRASFAAMLSLPPDWRRGNRMIIESVRLAWPELLELPINRYGDWRDRTRLIGRALRNPRLVLKTLRKRFG